MSLVVDRDRAEQLNLTVLRRIDPDVEEVLATAGHVCLYHMTVTSQQWARKNVEGSLFVLKRKSAPRFKMIVLNKMSTDNYTETIHSDFEIEINAPYLMYTHGNDEIHGIWFYENADLDKISAMVRKIVTSLPKIAVPPAPVAAAAPAAPVAPAAPAASHQVAKQVVKADNFWDLEVSVPQGAPARSLQKPPSELMLPSQAQQQQAAVAAVQAQPGHVGAPPAGGLAAMLQKAHQRHVSSAHVAAPAPLPAPPSPQPDVAPPALLTPSQLQQSMPAAAAPTAAAAAAPNPLQQLFAKAGASHSRSLTDGDAERVRQQMAAMKMATAVPQQAAPAPSQLPTPQGAGPATPVRSAAELRHSLRQAMVRLLNNDAVLDALVVELRAAGLMQ